ncbi:bacillithiol biosynthesis deacetylase BshB1 [bacterium]|nr:bacillithiol biosynthesis deacetylase BshB1 [bacterium]
MTPEPLDVLIVAPHPDDAELGMAGTMLSMVQEGRRVGILDLTSGEPTPLGSKARRKQETEAATRELGIAWRGNLGLPNRSLEATLENRRALAEQFRILRPKVIFAPYWEDAHPDHLAATEMVEAAKFWAKLGKSDMAGTPFHPARILYYFSVHLRIVERPSVVIDISGFVDRKRKSLEAYASQLVENQPPGEPGVIDRVIERNRYWGIMAGVGHAEPFASREPVGLKSLRDFIP